MAVMKRGNLTSYLRGTRAAVLGERVREAGGRLAIPNEDVVSDLAKLVTELLVAESEAEHLRTQYGRDEQVDFLSIMCQHPLAVAVADKLAFVEANRASRQLGGVSSVIDSGGTGHTVTIAQGSV